MFLDEQMAVLPVIERISRPDAVLYDIGGYGGRIAAHTWDVPAVQLSPTYVAWEGYEDDMAEFTAGLKASDSGSRYFAMVADWLADNDYAIDADDSSAAPSAASCSSRASCNPTGARVRPLRLRRPVHRRGAPHRLDSALVRRPPARLRVARHLLHRPPRPLRPLRRGARRRLPARDRDRQGRPGGTSFHPCSPSVSCPSSTCSSTRTSS